MGCGLRLRRSGSGALPTAAPVASAAVFAGRLRRALVLRIADLSSPSAWPESRSTSPSHLSSETGIAKVGASEGTEQAAAGRPDFFFCFGLHVDCVWAGRIFLFFGLHVICVWAVQIGPKQIRNLEQVISTHN